MTGRKCEICGTTTVRIVTRDRIPGCPSLGIHPIAAVYDWDHHTPEDCLKTIKEKLDYLIQRICPNNGQEG